MNATKNERIHDLNTPLGTILYRQLGFIIVTGLRERGWFGSTRTIGSHLLASHLNCYAINVKHKYMVIVTEDSKVWLGNMRLQMPSTLDIRLSEFKDKSNDPEFMAIVHPERLSPLDLVSRLPNEFV